jgi:hypothetical protein
LIAALLVIAAALLLGVPLVGRSLRGPLRFGVAFLVGLAACAMLLLIVPWSRVTLGVAYALVLALGVVLSRGDGEGSVPISRRKGTDPSPSAGLGMTLALLLLLELIGYTLFATIAPLWEFDFLADWGLKGRVYALAQGIDWSFLQHAWYRATHADYPPLLPLSFDLVAIVNGGWDDRWIGLLYPAFALAGAAIAYGAAREEVGGRWAAAIAVIVFPLCATPWIGLADGPFAVTVLGAIVLLRRGNVAMGAVLAGCAALMKNEGYALIVGLAIGLLITRKKVWQLWPAVLIALPWPILRHLHGVEGDLAQGPVLARVLARLRDPLPLLQALLTNTPHRWLLWAGILLGILLVARRELFAFTVIATQWVAYIAVYFATPHDLQWHIRWSWERLVTHVWPALVLVLLVGLAKGNAGPEEAGVENIARGD